MPAPVLTEKHRERLRPLVPAGGNLDDLRILEVRAQAIPDSELTAAEEHVIQVASVTAGAPMINKDGRPTILRVVAWMCHGDVTNRNGDRFVKEELQALAPRLFREPNFGVMDWNHAAVYGFNDDPKIIGVWYGVEYAFDTAAGAWGLLAKGMAFAWLFPEQTDAMVAEQLRSGTAKFSMACIPSSVEFLEGAAVLHNPVFFTVSALDKPPADPDAQGTVSEDPTKDHEKLSQELLALPAIASMVEIHTASGTLVLRNVPMTMTSTKTTVGDSPAGALEDLHMEEIIVQLKAEKLTAEAKVTELAAEKSVVEQKLAATEKLVQASADETTALAAEVAALKTRLAELETSMTEANTAREGLATELAAAQEQIKALETEKAGLIEKLAAFEAKEAAVASQARLAARKAELPEAYAKAHAARKEEDRVKVEARWAAMSDEQWAEHRDELLVGFGTPKPGYVARSAAEGQLPSGTSGEDSPMARVARHIKR